MSKKEVAEVLRQALAALGPNGEHWVKVTPSEAMHGTFCASTALTSRSGVHTVNARKALCSAAGVSDSPLTALWNWNDDPERTWPDIKDAYERAIQIAEAP